MKKYTKPELSKTNIKANQAIATTLNEWLATTGSANGYSADVIVSYVIASE